LCSGVTRAVGILALAWPKVTILALVILFAVSAFIAAMAGTRAMYILGGLVSIVFGVVLFVHPHIGAFAIALLFGMFSLIYGVWELSAGIELRRASKDEPGEAQKTPQWRFGHRRAA
jgi:uncharacterized membrane protein HdeD (DUF308 family)